LNSKLQSIFARRSARRFTGQTVEPGLIQDVLEAAMAAPSAVAKDPWHFVVLQNPTTLARLASGLSNGRFLTQAAVAVAVCGDLERTHEGSLSFLLQDCSAATENMLIAATQLGLGSCWLGIHPREDRMQMVRTELKLPTNIVPVCLVALGWPAQRAEPRTRFRENAVHHEMW
jgi:nitroreductase